MTKGANMPLLRRFWIEFDRSDEAANWWPGPWVGVTGYDEQNCLDMVADLYPEGVALPRVLRIIPDVVVDENLSVNIRALGVPVWPGIWHPAINLRNAPPRRNWQCVGPSRRCADHGNRGRNLKS
ncbi:hypothetical protein [Nocardia sp. NPDC056100]|uniref:hypothetical protein n=1 Tax=Nocardia sp. NPDC056100 TaxID=3345712 RepID=UPI0035E130D8